MTSQVAAEAGARRMSYLEAIVEAQIEEMERDDRVILMGEDLAVYGGGKLVERFDSSRVWTMPISEGSFTGLGVGAAITGLRPIIDLNIASFTYLASDQIINQAAKLSYMTGGQVHVPLVIRACMFYGASIAAQHSDRPYPMFMNVPGLKIVSPTNPADVKGLLKSAIRDDGPVIFLEDSKLWTLKELVPTNPDTLVPIGKAAVQISGSDVTIVAISGAMRAAREAANILASDGVSVELIDPRTLKPLDMGTIIESVSKTGRLVIVENAHRVAAAGAEIAAELCERAFDCLRRPIIRLAAPDIHVPFSPALEKLLFPSAGEIVNAVKHLV
jgi:pyruvate/2-oxoglutarate/acetoin dehydrogenase E1 component